MYGFIQKSKANYCSFTIASSSKILQVKAAQLVPSEKYKVGYTLRFPRVVKIRLDKDWNECLDLAGLKEIVQQFGGKYARRKYADAAGETKPRKKRKLAPAVKKVIACVEQL